MARAFSSLGNQVGNHAESRRQMLAFAQGQPEPKGEKLPEGTDKSS